MISKHKNLNVISNYFERLPTEDTDTSSVVGTRNSNSNSRTFRTNNLDGILLSEPKSEKIGPQTNKLLPVENPNKVGL